MTPEESGLLSAILESPEDDGVRLIYADWLDDHGRRARAEHIRDSIRASHDQFAALTGGDPFELLGLEPLNEGIEFSEVWPPVGGNHRTWTWSETDDLGLSVNDHTRGLSYAVDRGFISRVACPMASWMGHGPGVAKAHPVAGVHLRDRKPWWGYAGVLSEWTWDAGQSAESATLIMEHEIDYRVAAWMAGRKVAPAVFAYDAESDAIDDASQAALKWARSQP